jgi:hypothetical protein
MDHATAEFAELFAGVDAGGQGNVLLTNASQVTMTLGEAVIGFAGVGKLEVSDGSSFVFDTASNALPALGIGGGVESPMPGAPTANGTVIVRGQGSKIIAEMAGGPEESLSLLKVGGVSGAKGRLEIRDNAEVAFGIAYIGRDLVSQNQVPDGKVLVDNALFRATYDGTSDLVTTLTGDHLLIVGENGQIDVQNAGRVESSIVGIFGSDTVGALVNVRDNGSLWKSAATLVGSTGATGLLNITDGATGVVGQMIVGGGGSLYVTQGAMLQTSDTSYIGGESLNILLADKLEKSLQNAAGALVQGSDARWEVTHLVVGDASGSSGILQIDDSGLVTGDTITVNKNGKVVGDGGLLQVTDRVKNGGTIAPGLSPGVLTIAGLFEQTSAGRLEIEFAGVEPGLHDRLIITEGARLDGELLLRFIDGFAPKQGDEFQFLEINGDVSGDFATVQLAGLLPGFEFDLRRSDGGTTLVALNDAVAIPEPSTQASLMILFLLIAPTFRRRHHA